MFYQLKWLSIYLSFACNDDSVDFKTLLYISKYRNKIDLIVQNNYNTELNFYTMHFHAAQTFFNVNITW